MRSWVREKRSPIPQQAILRQRQTCPPPQLSSLQHSLTQVDVDDITPDTQLDQGKDKSRPSSNSPAMPDNDSPVTRRQTTRAMTSATSLGVGVPENDDYDEFLSINQAQSGQIQLLKTTTRRLKTQLVSNAVLGTQIGSQRIAEYAADLRPINPPKMENLKLILNLRTLSIAEYLDDLPMCSRIQDDKIYLECLLDITSSTPFI